jgi:hypothetical protein
MKISCICFDKKNKEPCQKNATVYGSDTINPNERDRSGIYLKDQPDA